MAIVMRAGKEKEIMVAFLDIDQAIAAHEIEFFAFLYPGLAMPCPFVDHVRMSPLMRDQAREDRFHLLRSEKRSTASSTESREALLELGITMNHYGHTLSPLPKITVRVPRRCRIASPVHAWWLDTAFCTRTVFPADGVTDNPVIYLSHRSF